MGAPPELQSVYGAGGTSEVGSIGLPTSYAKVLSGVQLLLEANVDLNAATACLIMSPRSWAVY